MQSRTLDTTHSNPSSIAVYRDPYLSLRKTALLFEISPSLASCVRRLWFHGYYGTETNTLIFSISRCCDNLDYLTVPWTSLRYGDVEDWSHLLGRNQRGRSISSLEFLAVDLKQAQISNSTDAIDKNPLNSPRVNFSGLRRLKVFGHSNFMPLVDEDLMAISQTATNLREIHITGTASVNFDSVAALVDSSYKTLETLEHSPLAGDGFEHPEPPVSHCPKNHLCRKFLQCPRLQNLSLSLPALCQELFADLSANWSGDVQVRTSTVCGHRPSALKTSDKAQGQFWCVLSQARALMGSRQEAGVELDIEIFINDWIFEPRHFLVHGNLQTGKTLSHGSWPRGKTSSCKGPYGQTGLYGKDDGPYECVTEDIFKEGLERRYVSF